MSKSSFQIVGLVALAGSASLACAGPPTTSSDELGGDTDSSADTSSADTSSTDTSSGELDQMPEPAPSLEPMVVMTFNVLCSFCDDTYDPWPERVVYTADTIARHAPDLIGLQELFTAAEVEQLQALIPGYELLFYSDDLSDYADATIAWRSDRYTPIDSGFYWLSPAPDTPFSVGFSRAFQFPRLVAWVQLRELASGAELLFVDTHFDNNQPSQQLSAPLLVERTLAQAGELPIVVVGDFNSQPDTPAYAILDEALTNSFDLAQTWSVETNEAVPTSYDPSTRIDHVFVAGGAWAVPWWVVDTWVYGAADKHSSDHFAIAARLEFEG